MIHELQPGRLRKARIWLGELPEPLDALTPRHTLERTLQPGPHRLEEHRKVVLEMYIPSGPVTHGVLLGAEFLPRPGPLELHVLHDEHEGPRLDWTYQPMDVGITSEFAPWIAEGAEQACVSGGLGAGALRFAWGATSPVGTSPLLSKRVAGLVVELLLLYPSGPSASDALRTRLRRDLLV